MHTLHRKVFTWTFSLLLSLGILFVPSASSASGAEPVDFNRQVRPLLAKHCYACHGADQAESGLRLDVRDVAVAAVDSGQVAVVPGNPQESELLARVSSNDESLQMPPEGKRLTADEIALIAQWISEGAEYTPHWAFQPISNPPIPVEATDSWCRNPIDAFILHRLKRVGLQPNTQADARTLIRRLYYNTIGAPPSVTQIEQFVAAGNDELTLELAYSAAVDELLANPMFGERWGRSWLDVVRYAETNSFERDGPKPNAWKYRDYVIDAFNSDKPYDQFLREQLAGDELPNRSRETLIATGYYRLGLWDDEPADPELAVFDGYDDLVTVTGQGMLGLTMNCARCHDHKIDPISQKDYYAMVAFFRDVTPYGTRSDERTNSQIDLSDPNVLQRLREIDSQLAEQDAHKRRIEDFAIKQMDAEYQRAAEGADRERVVAEKLYEYLDQSLKTEYEFIKGEIIKLQQEKNALPSGESVLGLAVCLPEPPETFVLARGSPQAPTDKVDPSFLSLMNEKSQPAIQRSDKSAGRRTALANWIVSENNWLTARVIVNRMWQHHFGRGIVRSSNNFGQLGDFPTHPELLDFLAQQLIAHEWNMKPIHRMIMTSSVYRMSSADSGVALKIDPRNDNFWRFDSRRLSAEELRDSMLQVTGNLNLKMGGESIFPYISDEVKAGQSVPGKGWGDSSPAEKARRSVYIYIKRSLVPPELSVFDFPDTDGTCEARFLTTQAAQSLNLLNGSFSRDCAMDLARVSTADIEVDKLDNDASLFQQCVSHAIQRVYQRETEPSDLEIAKELYEKMRYQHQQNPADAWAIYCLVLLNTNEFLYID